MKQLIHDMSFFGNKTSEGRNNKQCHPPSANVLGRYEENV